MIILGLIFIIIGYVLGSLSSAILVCKMMGLADPRSEGSGNPGATNVLRIGGKTPALLVLVGDILKGFLPVIIAHILGVEGFTLALVGLAAVIGHMFPVFFKFQGGKGVATGLGAVLALSFWVGIVAIIAWIVIVFVTRYVSLASMIAAIVAAVLFLLVHTTYFLPIAIMAGLIIWRHWENIQRLQAGNENKIDIDKIFKK